MQATASTTTTQATVPAGGLPAGSPASSLRDGKRFRWHDTRRM